MGQTLRDQRLEEWMRTHGPAVLATARRILRSQEAEDVFQEVFTRAYCRMAPFREDDHVRAWLLRVTINECRSRLRGAWRRVSLDDGLPVPCEVPFSPDLADAIRSLPRREREVVWLYHFAGFKTREIAQMVKAPDATVRTWLSRARGKLRLTLEEGGFFQ